MFLMFILLHLFCIVLLFRLLKSFLDQDIHTRLCFKNRSKRVFCTISNFVKDFGQLIVLISYYLDYEVMVFPTRVPYVKVWSLFSIRKCVKHKNEGTKRPKKPFSRWVHHLFPLQPDTQSQHLTSFYGRIRKNMTRTPKRATCINQDHLTNSIHGVQLSYSTEAFN